MQPSVLLLIGLIGLGAPQTGPELTLSPTLLERLYPGYDPATGLVEDSGRPYEIHTLSVQPFEEESRTLLVITRVPTNGGMAAGRSLDVVVIDRSGVPVKTGLGLFEFDGHSRITVEDRRYPDLEGARLIGATSHHTNMGMDGDTLHLVAIGTRIRDVMMVRTLFSDCGAPEPDRSILRRERTEIEFPSSEPDRLAPSRLHPRPIHAKIAPDLTNSGVFMARILGAVASSHSPTIGFALDQGKQNDPVWAPIFKGYEPVRQWLAEKQPDVLFLIFNDHVTSFFFDHYSQFALGVGASYAPADEGGGPRALPPVKGHTKLAHHIAQGLVADEFDLSYFQEKGLDHGAFSPLSMLWPHEPDWPGAMIPFQVGVLEAPVPSARRCYKLGQSLRRAIESYPEDLKVVIVATGGLSHQVHGERCGFNNTDWDMEFLELLEKDPVRLTEMTIAEYATLGGFEGAEVIMWLIMRGALSSNIRKIHQSYYLPSMTALATLVYENEASETRPEAKEEYLEHIRHQLAGVEKLEGTYPFTIETSVRAYRLNKFLHDLIDRTHRELFLKDEEKAFEQAGLTEEERDMVRRRDWRALIHYGVIFFMLEKLGAVVGTSNPHIYAAMRGQSLEDFQKTRNAQVMYSVAGEKEHVGFDQEGS